MGERSVRHPPPLKGESDTKTTSNISVKMGVNPEAAVKGEKGSCHNNWGVLVHKNIDVDVQ